MLSVVPTGAQSELFDFTAYNHRFGKRFGLRTRLGPSRPFLDESLSLTDPIQEATLLTWSERFRHHPATYLLAVGCLLYTSDAADERSSVDLGGRRILKKKHNRKKTKLDVLCLGARHRRTR